MFRTFIRYSRRSFSSPTGAAATTSSGTGGGVSSELKLTFGTPHQPIYVNHTIQGLSLPSDDGYFTILPNKIPQIAQLKAGLVTIHHVGVSSIYPPPHTLYFNFYCTSLFSFSLNLVESHRSFFFLGW